VGIKSVLRLYPDLIKDENFWDIIFGYNENLKSKKDYIKNEIHIDGENKTLYKNLTEEEK
jgi:hypothetical protein